MRTPHPLRVGLARCAERTLVRLRRVAEFDDRQVLASAELRYHEHRRGTRLGSGSAASLARAQRRSAPKRPGTLIEHARQPSHSRFIAGDSRLAVSVTTIESFSSDAALAFGDRSLTT